MTDEDMFQIIYLLMQQLSSKWHPDACWLSHSSTGFITSVGAADVVEQQEGLLPVVAAAEARATRHHNAVANVHRSHRLFTYSPDGTYILHCLFAGAQPPTEGFIDDLALCGRSIGQVTQLRVPTTRLPRQAN